MYEQDINVSVAWADGGKVGVAIAFNTGGGLQGVPEGMYPRSILMADSAVLLLSNDEARRLGVELREAAEDQ